MKRILSVIGILCVLCIMATACHAAKMSSSNPRNDSNGVMISEDAAESKTVTTADGDVNPAIKNDFDKRKLIKDVSLGIQTKSFDEFMSNLQKEIAASGGYIEQSNITGNSYSYNSFRSASIKVRIPAEKLDDFTSHVSSLGNIINKSEKVQDVTMDYVDTESHIKALKTEQDSLLALLEKASNLNDILTVQEELTKVRSELESYESRLRTYDSLISYSTLTMDINEVEQITKVEKQDVWQTIGSKFTTNLKNIGNGFQQFFIWFVSALPYLLLIAVFSFLILIIVRKLYKKHKINRANTDAATLPPLFPPENPEDKK